MEMTQSSVLYKLSIDRHIVEVSRAWKREQSNCHSDDFIQCNMAG